MALSLAELEAEVIQLSSADREKLIRLLITSLEAEPEEDQQAVEAAWELEVERRSREIEEGKVELVPADEALARIRNSLR
jgi:putative addiction module component (TIGR02574 family)